MTTRYRNSGVISPISAVRFAASAKMGGGFISLFLNREKYFAFYFRESAKNFSRAKKTMMIRISSEFFWTKFLARCYKPLVTPRRS
jgi:hypothetical protein